MTSNWLTRWSLVSTTALIGCLPNYDNHAPDISALVDLSGAGDGDTDGGNGDMSQTCTNSGQTISGRLYSWGPASMVAGFVGGPVGNVAGCPSLIGPMATTTEYSVPLPTELLGTKGFLQFQGTVTSTVANNPFTPTPILNEVSGPVVIGASTTSTRHLIVDQSGGLLDTLQSSINLNPPLQKQDPNWCWIYGVFLDPNNGNATGAKITIDPAKNTTAAVDHCAIYYNRCEFAQGVPCSGGLVDSAAQQANVGFFSVICDKRGADGVSGMITLSAAGGGNTYDDIQMPCTMPNVNNFDLAFADWFIKQ